MKRGQRRHAQDRARERWTREDAAARLADEITDLTQLVLEIEESLGASVIDSAHYVRHILVEQAPAHFELPCSDTKCDGGGHDLTQTVMDALRAGETEFKGESACGGQSGTDPCRRVLRFTARATY